MRPLNCSGHRCPLVPRPLAYPPIVKHDRDSCPQLADVEDRRNAGMVRGSTVTHLPQRTVGVIEEQRAKRETALHCGIQHLNRTASWNRWSGQA